MRTLRFHRYGEPLDVLRLEEAPIPKPAADCIRVRVQACALNPADWALCRGLFPGNLPRGVGLDVAGVTDAVGERVDGVQPGDPVFGVAAFAGYASAGLADFAILNHWAAVPMSLAMSKAAALPMAVATAHAHLDALGELRGKTLLIHGAGTVIGLAAVQVALRRGAVVLVTAGETFSPNCVRWEPR